MSAPARSEHHDRARRSKTASPTGPREAIIDAATAPSGLFEYIDRDSLHTLCWRCSEPLAVRFKHLRPETTARLVGVELHCTGGCAEGDLASLFEGVAT